MFATVTPSWSGKGSVDSAYGEQNQCGKLLGVEMDSWNDVSAALTVRREKKLLGAKCALIPCERGRGHQTVQKSS